MVIRQAGLRNHFNILPAGGFMSKITALAEGGNELSNEPTGNVG
jgi:hypothetical protein